MASADLRDELNCSICLSVYTDPVTLGCGHNFCRVCIDRVLNTQKVSGNYLCPECRHEFPERPALQRNITLCNIAQRLLSTWKETEDMGVCCTYCVDSPVPALKSCLLCDASLCDKHLRVHSKSPEHVLTEPSTSLENRKCPVHKKILEYYCTTDDACVCVSCSLAGEHRGHQVEMLDAACGKKMAALTNVLQQAIKDRTEAEDRVLKLQEHRNNIKEKAKAKSEEASVLLRKTMEELERSVLDEISGQELGICQSLNAQILELEIQKNDLSKKIHDMEEMFNLSDQLTFLQQTKHIKTQGASVHPPFINLTQGPAQNLDVNKIHSALHRGLNNAVAQIKATLPVEQRNQETEIQRNSLFGASTSVFGSSTGFAFGFAPNSGYGSSASFAYNNAPNAPSLFGARTPR